jgi:NADH dehydrogenase
MILVVGATGMLGSEICRLLAEDGRPVRALVRETSNPDRIAALSSLGAELVHGDLKDRRSLDAACRGGDRRHLDGLVDHLPTGGRLHRDGGPPGTARPDRRRCGRGVGHFVLVSFPGTDVEFPCNRRSGPPKSTSATAA